MPAPALVRIASLRPNDSAANISLAEVATRLD